MPLFMIQCVDYPNVLEKRLAARPKHIERLNTLNDAGRLVLAGPMPLDANDTSKGFYGSLIVADFADQHALDEWLEQEPYILAGVYQSVTAKPFIQVFPQVS
ncbi:MULTISPECIES: YciI family protein [unclassified Acinetobacter]|uniref:YciI family protein n=1 Tax=unclassified Acinetobacter TaxID=196816 RepID=UPI0035BAECCD